MKHLNFFLMTKVFGMENLNDMKAELCQGVKVGRERAEQSFSNYPNKAALSGILSVPLGKKVMLIENNDI